MSLSPAARSDLRRAMAIAAFAAYLGITAALYQRDAAIDAHGEALSRRNRAIRSELFAVTSALNHLESAGGNRADWSTRLREKRDQVTREQRDTALEYETWKAQSSGWRVKRWFALAIVTFAFLPVVVWGYRSWEIWSRDKRVNRSVDD